MSAGTTTPSTDSPSLSPVTGWCAVLAVTLGIFALMTSELLPVGLLTPVSTDLGVSEGTAGLMVTVPGLVAVASAPLTTVAVGNLDRRLVLGVPAATLVGDTAGWRVAFAAVGALGLAALACMLVLLPRIPPQRTIQLRDLPAVFRSNTAVRVGTGTAFLLVTSHFLAYTFVRPLLRGDGVSGDLVSTLLLVFGVAGICGNFAAGALLDNHLRRVVLGISLVLAAAMALFAITDLTAASSAALLVLWGLGYGAVPVTLQTWIIRSSPGATEAASSLYVAVFNLSIALGALLGGVIVDSVAAAGVLWAGCGLAALALPLIARTSAPPRG
ncbi:MFS transporter [Haloactinospora alba]|uniref:MFS transporter n=1 Tax=Haloactinospora alba TaxID=405555 RepID=A0A543N9H9_9ACTN|nr:MFS transporter [Haloactinospora alba]TQN28467.1 MFS transporter [Haloactinospora alba]